MAKTDRNRQRLLKFFLSFCDRVGFAPEPFQRKVAGAFFGPEREFLAFLPRGNGKSRLVGALSVHHLISVPNPRVYVAAASREQAGVVPGAPPAFPPPFVPAIEINHRGIRT